MYAIRSYYDPLQLVARSQLLKMQVGHAQQPLQSQALRKGAKAGAVGRADQFGQHIPAIAFGLLGAKAALQRTGLMGILLLV